ncbi:uncharacterized protein ACRADG_008506 isoform 1-T2 [Cochliomyia hominivorax]
MAANDSCRVILELIKLYRSLPVLWDFKHPDYGDRFIRERKYDILLKKYRELRPNAKKNELLKKLYGLRNGYSRELLRIQEAEKKGEIIKSTLYYYNAMNFLKDIVNSSRRANNEEETTEINSSSIADLVKVAAQPLLIPKDRPHLLAFKWAKKLSGMKRRQRLIAEKLINETIFKAELDLLHPNINVTNTTEPIYDSNPTSSFNVNNHEESYVLIEPEIDIKMD